MTLIPTAPSAVSDVAISHDRPYVDWGAILAGTVIATSITLALTGFGSAIGLSMTSVNTGQGFSAMAVVIAMGLWVIWVAVTSLMAGSYVTGRLRRRVGDATPHEVSVRDGAHGLVVWALSAIIGATIATMTVAGVVRTGAAVVGTGVTAAAGIAANTTDYAVDVLVRNDAPNAANAPATLDDATRQQISRLVVRAAAEGQFSAQDRTFLTRTIAARAGVEPVEVERRIDAFASQAKAAVDRTRAAAESARRLGILIAFVTAASLAVAAAGAWWGASLGGRHRDENTDFSHLMRW